MDNKSAKLNSNEVQINNTDVNLNSRKNIVGNYLYLFFEKTGILFLLIIFIIVLTIMTNGIFLRFSNIMNVLTQSSIVGVTALGMTFVMIICGIDLSVGGITAICSSIGAILMVNYEINWLITVLVMLLVGMFFGLINGLSIAKLKLAPFIVTLAMMNITRGISQYMLGGRTVFGLPDSHKSAAIRLGPGRVCKCDCSRNHLRAGMRKSRRVSRLLPCNRQ